MNRQHRLAHLVALVMISVCVLAVPALAQDCPELVGRWPFGPAYAVAVSGGHAYYGIGAALVVADVADPSAPHRVGEVALPCQGRCGRGGYAFAPPGRFRLMIMTRRRLRRGRLRRHAELCQRVAVEGLRVHRERLPRPAGDRRQRRRADRGRLHVRAELPSGSRSRAYAYMANDWLQVIDVARRPPGRGRVPRRAGQNSGVAVSGNYVASRTLSGLRVIDVSSTTPSRLVSAAR
jgi:hypothetical protein